MGCLASAVASGTDLLQHQSLIAVTGSEQATANPALGGGGRLVWGVGGVCRRARAFAAVSGAEKDRLKGRSPLGMRDVAHGILTGSDGTGAEKCPPKCAQNSLSGNILTLNATHTSAGGVQ